MTIDGTSYPPSSDRPVSSIVTMKCVGKLPAGMHAISGSWVPGKVEKLSENALVVTFEETQDGLKMSQPTGDHYDAKFDGKEYAYEGSAQINKVVLKRIGPAVIEETDKWMGKSCIQPG